MRVLLAIFSVITLLPKCAQSLTFFAIESAEKHQHTGRENSEPEVTEQEAALPRRARRVRRA